MSADAASQDAVPPGPTAAHGIPLSDALLTHVLRFNLFPAQYADPGWLREAGLWLEGSDKPGATTCPFWTRRLSERLLDALELDRLPDFDFLDHGKRLALLDSPLIAHLARLAAAILVRDALRTVVHGPDVALLREVVGADAHHAALAWKHPLPKLPQAFARFSLQTLDQAAWAQRTAALARAAIPPGANGVIIRLGLRFPVDHWPGTTPSREQRLQEHQRQALVDLFKRLIGEHTPAWNWLFDAQ